MAYRILIDPGHYTNYNRSPIVKEYYEGNQMWKLSQYLIPALKAYGFEVGCTKTSLANYPKDGSGQDAVVTRGRMGKGYDFALSLHTNAADSSAVDRAVALVFVDDDCGEIDDISYKLGQKIGAAVKNTMGLSSLQIVQQKSSNDRDGDGKRNDDYYGFLYGAHQAGTAAVLMEHGFHTHAATARWLLSDANLKKLAEAEAAVLAEWFGLKKTAATPPASTPQPAPASGDQLYRIRKTWADAKSQTGAYKNLDNAKKACGVGFKVFDKDGKVVYDPAAAAGTATQEPAKEYPQFQDKTKANGIKYKVKAEGGLNLRAGAGVINPKTGEENTILATLPDGSTVTWYGFYSTVYDTDWYWVKTADGRTGFVSSKYLR